MIVTFSKISEPSEEISGKVGQRVMLFDELMQHGRAMHELRENLEAVNAEVFSIVCVRRRSHAESGELIEYEAF